MKNNKNIVLCGFMGCGKTTVGKIISKSMEKELIDLDEYIEKKEGEKIAEIFESKGEEYFRDLEHNAVKELSNRKDIIISAGGGTLVYKRNVDILKENSVIIYIDSSLKKIKERLKNDTKRPLLQKKNKDEIMKELYDNRVPIYKKASDLIVNGDSTPKIVAENICKIIKN